MKQYQRSAFVPRPLGCTERSMRNIAIDLRLDGSCVDPGHETRSQGSVWICAPSEPKNQHMKKCKSSACHIDPLFRAHEESVTLFSSLRPEAKSPLAVSSRRLHWTGFNDDGIAEGTTAGGRIAQGGIT
jgi:hypothetical protein